MIPYGRHSINKQDLRIVNKVLNSNFLTQGPYIKKFEHDINKFCGSRFSSSVSRNQPPDCLQ